MNNKNLPTIGIDLGGTNIKAGVLLAGKILATASIPTKAERGWKAVVGDMAKTARLACEKAGVAVSDCTACGVGCPGTIDACTGVVLYSNNLAWENVPLAEVLSKDLNLTVKISNDANCAALGECVLGAAKGAKSAVLLTLGTGVGGGVICDGKLFDGGAGGIELGHIQLVDDGELCTCGRKGCFETCCSATALIRHAEKHAKANPESTLYKLWEQNDFVMNGKIPFDATEQGDATARAVTEQYIEWLAKGVTSLVNIFRPEIVLLSGGVCAQGEVLTKPVEEHLAKYAFASKQLKTPPVKIATLGNDAGIVGAASLVI